MPDHWRAPIAAGQERVPRSGTPHQSSADFLSAEEATTPDQMANVFGRERFERLTAVKRAYDPSNTFRINHNVPAARSTSAEMFMALAV